MFLEWDVRFELKDDLVRFIALAYCFRKYQGLHLKKY